MYFYRQRNDKLSRAKEVKSNLDKGLNLWRSKVLKVQSESIRKAEEKLKEEVEKKHYGMKYRRKKKEQSVETFKKQLTLKQQKALNATTEKIEDKDKKVRFQIFYSNQILQKH